MRFLKSSESRPLYLLISNRQIIKQIMLSKSKQDVYHRVKHTHVCNEHFLITRLNTRNCKSSSYEVSFKHSCIFTQDLEPGMVRENLGWGVRFMLLHTLQHPFPPPYIGSDRELAVFSKVQVVFIEAIIFLAA